MRNLDIRNDNILECNEDMNKLSNMMESMFRNIFSDNDTVYFFDECFNGLEVYPENPSMGGPVRMRNNDIEGLIAILRGVVIGGRTGITLMVNFKIETLKDNDCFNLLREFCNADNGCNLIMSCANVEELEDFNFDYKVNV